MCYFSSFNLMLGASVVRVVQCLQSTKASAAQKSALSCITHHPGFESNCLDVWVLETAYMPRDNSMAQSITWHMSRSLIYCH